MHKTSPHLAHSHNHRVHLNFFPCALLDGEPQPRPEAVQHLVSLKLVPPPPQPSTQRLSPLAPSTSPTTTQPQPHLHLPILHTHLREYCLQHSVPARKKSPPAGAQSTRSTRRLSPPWLPQCHQFLQRTMSTLRKYLFPHVCAALPQALLWLRAFCY